MHATNKDWICDCCGSHFGTKKVLWTHMKTHLPPSYSCSKCDRKFVYAHFLQNHEKLHQRILNEICKHCKKGFPTKNLLNDHVISQHFERLHCEFNGSLITFNCKFNYKSHLKRSHRKDDQILIKKLLLKLNKKKPDFQQLKYI